MSLKDVTPHEAFDGLYVVEGWTFDLEDDEGDGNIEYVDRAIRAWNTWREFVLHQQALETGETLF